MSVVRIDRIERRPFEIDVMRARALAKIQAEEDRRLWMGIEGYWCVEDEREEGV